MSDDELVRATVHEMPSVVRPEIWGVVWYGKADGGCWHFDKEHGTMDEGSAWMTRDDYRRQGIPSYVFSIPAQGTVSESPEKPSTSRLTFRKRPGPMPKTAGEINRELHEGGA